MVVGEDSVSHRVFKEFPALLQPDDLLILNDSKVIKARLEGEKDTGGRFQLLVERVQDVDTALCYIRVSRPLKPGRTIQCRNQSLEVVGRDGVFYSVRFPMPVLSFLEQHGTVPLPPYLGRDSVDEDEKSYQTVYAASPGSVAAPTAGLHFTQELLDEIKASGIEVQFVTLHVGLGTFKPVDSENLSEHQMHNERFEIPGSTLRALNSSNRRKIAVGTTVVRTLESWARSGKTSGETDIFITPGFRFQVVDAMLTNLHLPESTLLMLVAAFSGYERIKKAYEAAVESNYRFFSYGDAMFLTRYDV